MKLSKRIIAAILALITLAGLGCIPSQTVYAQTIESSGSDSTEPFVSEDVQPHEDTESTLLEGTPPFSYQHESSMPIEDQNINSIQEEHICEESLAHVGDLVPSIDSSFDELPEIMPNATFVDYSVEPANYTTAVSSVDELVSRLNALINKYQNTYWTQSGSACSSHSGTCYSRYYYAWQCKGFAGYIFNDLFCGGNIGPYSSSYYYIPSPHNASLIGQASGFGSSDTATVKNILSSAQPGDFIQVRRRNKNYGHSMIVVSVTSDGLYLFDCNSDGKCGVKYYYQSFATFASKNSGMSLYRSTKYPSGNISCSCSTSYAGNYVCTTSTANLLIRSGHGSNYGSVGKIPPGATVYVSKASGTGTSDWAHVEYNGVSGFASMGYLKKESSNKAEAPTIQHWLSDSEYGDPVGDLKVGNRYYYCFRLYDSVSGKDWDEVESCDYTITIYIYNPDGTLNYSHSSSYDTGWLSIYYTEPGTYSRRVKMEGDYTVDVTYDFTVYENPKEIHSSSDELDLNLEGTSSEIIYVWTTGYYGPETIMRWEKSNSNISCAWGEWENGLLPLTVSANSKGTATITLSVRDKATDAALDTYIVTVNVEAPSYTISYNANGGSGAPSSQTKEYGVPLTLSSTIPTRFGYTFLGWSTSSSATSPTYYAGDSFTNNSNTTLYAVWGTPAQITGNYAGFTRTADVNNPGAGVYYAFVPYSSTYYRIYGTDDVDTRVYLYDASGNQLGADDDSGDGNQFQLDYYFTAGTTYYIYVRYYSSTQTGDLDFKISYAYRIQYNANGGTGAPATTYKYYNFDTTLSTTAPTRSGHSFLGWATSSSATSAAYQPGATFSENTNTTLYAVWSQNSYTVSYNANGGSGAPSSQTKSGGTALTLSSTVPTRFGYTFLGWATSSTATSATYLPGGSFTTDANTTLYAVWQSASTISSGVTSSSYTTAISFANGYKYYVFTPSFTGKVRFESTGSLDTRVYLYDASGSQLAWDDDTGDSTNFQLTYNVTSGTQYYVMVRMYSTGTGSINFTVKRAYDVTFNANGGSGAPSAQTKVYGTALTLSSTVPTRSGYDFLGWSTSSTATAATYQPGGTYSSNSNLTLYAVWASNCDNGHSYSYKVTQSPTTSATGTITGTCSKCSGVTSVTLPKLNTTDYSYSVTKAATCTTSGTGRYTWKTTTYGSFYFNVTIPAAGHSYTSKVTASTCTVQGYTTHTCSACGDSYVDSYTAALGHQMGSWTTVTAPTCTAAGTQRRDCSRCDHYETQSVAATGHDYENGSCVHCGAEDPDAGASVVTSGYSGSTTWVLTDDGVLTFSGSGAMKNYEYKSEMPWYSYMSQISSVVIEEGVTSIGAYAFYGMNIESIQIPGTVTTIGDYAFKNAAKLDNVVLPSGLTKLGESAFYACSSLTSIEIPTSLWTVQPYTFKNCTSLASVTFHDGNLQKISDGAFYGTALTAVELPDCLAILDVYVFKNCSQLAQVKLSSSLTQIREASLYGTAISTIEIPEGVTAIKPYAFKNCVNLVSVSLPSTLTSVDEAAFYACTKLAGITLPDSVTTIGNYAFRKCSGLTSVKFGSGLVTIGESSFYGCTGITSLSVPRGVTTIKGYAFKGCTGLISVSLPTTLTTLGESAFHSCTGLSEVIIPAKVSSIGEYCFSGSTGIKVLEFLGNAPSIGAGAFNKITATAYYPGDNTTWASDIMQNYGGTITWKAQ